MRITRASKRVLFSVLPTGLIFVFFLCSCGDGEKREVLCGVPENFEVKRNPQVWPLTVETRNGLVTVAIQPDSGKIEAHKHFTLDVKVNSPTTGEYIMLVDADMPAHRHGMNTKPEITTRGEDHYQVDGMLFHMTGDWVITVKIKAGEYSESLEFPVFVE